MDSKTNDLLQEILNQQTKQTELLQKHLPPLWRKIRFSLLALMILMTLVAVGLGFGIAAVKSLNKTPTPAFPKPPQLPSEFDPFGTPNRTPPPQHLPDDIFGNQSKFEVHVAT